MRPVAPNVFKINGTFALTEPLDNLWVRFQTFYRYSHYQKFVDIWEDGCGLFGNKTEARVLKVLLDSFIDNNVQFNFELQCPLKGVLNFYHPHANVSLFCLLVDTGQIAILQWVKMESKLYSDSYILKYRTCGSGINQ